MALAAFKYNLILHLKNIPGPTTDKKVVVFECDDYGGIRMPSLEAYEKMKAAGVAIDPSRYNLLDTLEDKDDLSALFETLSAVRDQHGHAAVFSPFVNVANPDFEKIKAAGYREYFYEPFTTTLQKYGRNSDTMAVWREGMRAGIFLPEFHGREHLSVQPWMQHLQNGNEQLRTALNYGFAAVTNIAGVHDYAQEFRPEFYFTQESQKPFLRRSIIEGAKLFEQLFGYTPVVFTPSNSLFHHDLENTVVEAGIRFLNVAHKNPYPAENGALGHRTYSFKQKIKQQGLNYYIRNAAFEPCDENYQSIDLTIKQIAAAFRLNKPAIISTHRVNFIGGLNKVNRASGLRELALLLKTIVKRWPRVEFMGAGDLLKSLK